MKLDTQIYKPNSYLLKLSTFRNIYKILKTPWKPINWLILGYLVGIEKRYIDFVSKATVDKAIKDYMVSHPPEVYEAVVKEHEDGSFSIGKAYEDLP